MLINGDTEGAAGFGSKGQKKCKLLVDGLSKD